MKAFANSSSVLVQREPEQIKVIKQTESGAVVSNDLGGTQTDERLTLQAALGMRANQSYLVSERNLVLSKN